VSRYDSGNTDDFEAHPAGARRPKSRRGRGLAAILPGRTSARGSASGRGRAPRVRTPDPVPTGPGAPAQDHPWSPESARSLCNKPSRTGADRSGRKMNTPGRRHDSGGRALAAIALRQARPPAPVRRPGCDRSRTQTPRGARRFPETNPSGAAATARQAPRSDPKYRRKVRAGRPTTNRSVRN
jgi:hypothetical protein